MRTHSPIMALLEADAYGRSAVMVARAEEPEDPIGVGSARFRRDAAETRFAHAPSPPTVVRARLYPGRHFRRIVRSVFAHAGY
jgi:hypothetical protein